MVTFSGPVTRIIYEGNGDFSVRKLGTKTVENKHFSKLGIIVGGTGKYFWIVFKFSFIFSGITPMLQIIDVILRNPNDPTKIWMLFANNTPADVLLK